MRVFKGHNKPDWSWPTRLAPLLHKIMLCLGLSYAKGGAILKTINMFSQWRQNVKSFYFKILALPHLPLTFLFTTSLWSCPECYISLLLPVHDIIYSSSNTEKKPTVYIFLTGLCASCFCTVCPVHLVRVRLNMWMGEDSAWQYASCIYSKQNKAHWCLLSGH